MNLRAHLEVTFILGVIVAATLQSGCLTMYTVAASQGYFNDSARIVALHRAAVQAEDVLVQVSIRGHGRHDTHTLLFSVPVAAIGSTKYTVNEAPLVDGKPRLMNAQRGRVQAFGSAFPDDASIIPVEKLSVRDYNGLRDCVRHLQPGVHVIAVAHDKKLAQQCGESSAAGSIEFDKHTTVGLAVIEPDRQPRTDVFWAFAMERTNEPGWLLLTPLSAAGDLITLPFQVIGFILSGGEM